MIINSESTVFINRGGYGKNTDKTGTRIPPITTVGYNGRRGDGSLASQDWTSVSGATFTPMAESDGNGGYYLHIVKNSGQVWEIKQPAVPHPEDLIRYGGRLFCRFRLSGSYAEGRYAFAFYLKVNTSEIPAGVTLQSDGSTGMNPMLMNFAVITRGGNITLCQHRGNNSGNMNNIGSWGKFDNEWHTLELIYPGNNGVMITPVLDEVSQEPVSLSWSSAIAPLDTLYITGITGGTVYVTDVRSFEGLIFRDNGEYRLNPNDNGNSYFFPAGYHKGKINIPDIQFPQGFSVTVSAQSASVTLHPESNAVLLQPQRVSEGYPVDAIISSTVRLIQAGANGKTWVIV
ncbi:hypothetical protein KD625_002950 [Salmonella enterica subsp. enterica serovar Bonariensis]|nr:hypothetical protein [Salmonella enterica subsp. enterica serovar Bonariensis]